MDLKKSIQGKQYSLFKGYEVFKVLAKTFTTQVTTPISVERLNTATTGQGSLLPFYRRLTDANYGFIAYSIVAALQRQL